MNVRNGTEGRGFEQRQTKASTDCCKGQACQASSELFARVGRCEVVVRLADKKIEVIFPRISLRLITSHKLHTRSRTRPLGRKVPGISSLSENFLGLGDVLGN